MKQKAKDWIKKKVLSEITGNCCSLSNDCEHKYPIVLRTLDTRYPDMDRKTNENIIKSFNKIKFLLYNFGEFIDVDNVIDDFYSREKNQNHWYTEEHVKTFKLYVRDALVEVRDNKLEDIGI